MHTNKYLREVADIDQPWRTCCVDVYSVLEAFQVYCPATQHAAKKLLCAGLRGHKTTLQDLCEARAALDRAIELQHARDKHDRCTHNRGSDSPNAQPILEGPGEG